MTAILQSLFLGGGNMKKIMIFISSLVLLFSITACNAHSTYECNPIFVFDTTVTMVFYDQDDYKDYWSSK